MRDILSCYLGGAEAKQLSPDEYKIVQKFHSYIWEKKQLNLLFAKQKVILAVI